MRADSRVMHIKLCYDPILRAKDLILIKLVLKKYIKGLGAYREPVHPTAEAGLRVPVHPTAEAGLRVPVHPTAEAGLRVPVHPTAGAGLRVPVHPSAEAGY